mmetsp:Transcript_27696/g.85817  ORF Transcript_27696/g.85817 Transcript_27696/m.85817 type:complete len:778 (+) Transcript_27696:1827-4160(+)
MRRAQEEVLRVVELLEHERDVAEEDVALGDVADPLEALHHRGLHELAVHADGKLDVQHVQRGCGDALQLLRRVRDGESLLHAVHLEQQVEALGIAGGLVLQRLVRVQRHRGERSGRHLAHRHAAEQKHREEAVRARRRAQVRRVALLHGARRRAPARVGRVGERREVFVVGGDEAAVVARVPQDRLRGARQAVDRRRLLARRVEDGAVVRAVDPRDAGALQVGLQVADAADVAVLGDDLAVDEREDAHEAVGGAEDVEVVRHGVRGHLAVVLFVREAPLLVRRPGGDALRVVDEHLALAQVLVQHCAVLPGAARRLDDVGRLVEADLLALGLVHVAGVEAVEPRLVEAADGDDGLREGDEARLDLHLDLRNVAAGDDVADAHLAQRGEVRDQVRVAGGHDGDARHEGVQGAVARRHGEDLAVLGPPALAQGAELGVELVLLAALLGQVQVVKVENAHRVVADGAALADRLVDRERVERVAVGFHHRHLVADLLRVRRDDGDVTLREAADQVAVAEPLEVGQVAVLLVERELHERVLRLRREEDQRLPAVGHGHGAVDAPLLAVVGLPVGPLELERVTLDVDAVDRLPLLVADAQGLVLRRHGDLVAAVPRHREDLLGVLADDGRLLERLAVVHQDAALGVADAQNRKAVRPAREDHVGLHRGVQGVHLVGRHVEEDDRLRLGLDDGERRPLVVPVHVDDGRLLRQVHGVLELPLAGVDADALVRAGDGEEHPLRVPREHARARAVDLRVDREELAQHHDDVCVSCSSQRMCCAQSSV